MLNPWKMGPIGCPETSVTNYHYALRKFPKKQNSFTTRREAEITQDSNMVMFRKGTIFVGMLVHALKIGATKTWTVSSGYDIQITTMEFISWHCRATTLTRLVPCVTIIPCEILRYDPSAFVLHFGTAAPLGYELQSVGCLFAQPSSSWYRSFNPAPFPTLCHSVGHEMQSYQPHLQSVAQ